MDYLTIDEVLLIHSMLLDETGGLHGIRDREALLSIVSAPRQSVFGKELYPTLFSKAAVYAREIIMRHPFIDGNKRTGITTAIIFMEKNSVPFVARPKAIEHFALRIVTQKLSLDFIASWLRKHSVAR